MSVVVVFVGFARFLVDADEAGVGRQGGVVAKKVPVDAVRSVVAMVLLVDD